MISFDQAYAKALAATGLSDAGGDLRTKIRALAEVIGKVTADAYGDVHQALWLCLEADLRRWVHAHPPGADADYDVSRPRGAIYLYADELLPSVKAGADKVEWILQQPRFDKLVQNILKTAGKKDSKGEAKKISGRYPEYPALLRDVREAKKAWKDADARIKTTPAFRMMGGLARMGTREGVRYRSLVDQAQRMEREVLGRTLTEYKRVRG